MPKRWVSVNDNFAFPVEVQAVLNGAHVFKVEDYGAVGNGTTDDTAAINTAVAAAVAYGQSHNQYAEVVFRDRTYLLSSATTKTTTNKGNAQIPLPVVSTSTAQKLTLVFRGVMTSSAPPNFGQNPVQYSGTVLKSTLTGLSTDGTFGAPSIIGGPTPQQGYGVAATFSNVMPVVDGICVQAPLNPTIMGFDFRGCAAMEVIRAMASVSDTVDNIYNTVPSHSWATGLYAPMNLNNAEVNIGWYACYGYYYGIASGAHLAAQTIKAIACNRALYLQSDGNDRHGGSVGYISAELVQWGIEADGSAPNSGRNYGIDIGMLDMEAVSVGHILDPQNALAGHINLWSNDSSFTTSQLPAVVVTGATNVEIIAGNIRGALTAPTVPATTVALTNPFWRHCAVTITGGTVTVITVDGQSLGVTSGTVIVPSGKTITLTFSSAPTWKWTAL